MSSISTTYSNTPTRPALSAAKIARATLIAGAVVGVLDATDGVAYFGLTQGLNPIQVLQFIASGVLGRDAFTGGLPAAGIGALMHFALAYGFAGAFVLAYAASAAVHRNWAATGLAYGAAVWGFMNLLVLPMTLVEAAPLTAVAVLHGLIGHGVFVGFASAFSARWVLAQPEA